MRKGEGSIVWLLSDCNQASHLHTKISPAEPEAIFLPPVFKAVLDSKCSCIRQTMRLNARCSNA